MAIAPRVFLVQENAKQNYAPALDHGNEVIVLLPPSNQIWFSGARVVAELRRELAKHQFSEHDFIILAGDPAAGAIVACLAAERTGGRFKFLKWDRMHERYVPVTIDLTVK